MEGATENRAAREILERMGEKALFAYQQGMEITVPESDCRSSLDKIALYHRESQFALSDLYIGYAVSLYRYTIPKVGCSDNSGSGKLTGPKRTFRRISAGMPCSTGSRRCVLWECSGDSSMT